MQKQQMNQPLKKQGLATYWESNISHCNDTFGLFSPFDILTFCIFYCTRIAYFGATERLNEKNETDFRNMLSVNMIAKC